MSDLLTNPERWRERAQEARTLAERMSDPQGKGLMLAVAEAYDRLAERAEERANKSEREQG